MGGKAAISERKLEILGDYERFHLPLGKIELLQWYIESAKIILKYQKSF